MKFKLETNQSLLNFGFNKFKIPMEYQIINITFYERNYTLEVVYSDGNANVCEPNALTLGSSPALGIIFHDNVNVTLLFPLLN